MTTTVAPTTATDQTLHAELLGSRIAEGLAYTIGELRREGLDEDEVSRVNSRIWEDTVRAFPELHGLARHPDVCQVVAGCLAKPHPGHPDAHVRYAGWAPDRRAREPRP